MSDIPRIRELRYGLGLSLEEMGFRIGVSSRGRMSEIERGVLPLTPDQALAIERISDGKIDAARLNAVVAAARAGCDCSHLSIVEAATRFVLCEVCEKRTDDPCVHSCSFIDCPRRDRPSPDSAAPAALPQDAQDRLAA